MLCIRVHTAEVYRWEHVCADNLLDADPTVGLTSGYGGHAFNAEWEQDIDVGVVIACNKVPPQFCTALPACEGLKACSCIARTP